MLQTVQSVRENISLRHALTAETEERNQRRVVTLFIVQLATKTGT